MARRRGVTLVEVLVAIFIMGIGLIALLTLFPIGVLRMAQAIKNDRTAQAAKNGDRIALLQNIRNDPIILSDGVMPDLFVNPGPLVPNPPPQPGGSPLLPDADPYMESYPIFVDPIGMRSSPFPDWVGGNAYAGVLRRRPISQMNPTFILTNFSIWDDMNFESTLVNPFAQPGTPQNIAGVVMRDARYSWGYVLRRPQAGDKSIVDCTTVVFDKRSLSLAGNLTLPELVYQNQAYFNPMDNTITIDYGASLTTPIPPVRPGDWIMDATFYNPLIGTTPIPPAVAPAIKGTTSAFFYRVVATELVAAPGLPAPRTGSLVVRIEVQSPIRGSYQKYPLVADPLLPLTVPPAPPSVYRGTIIVMEGIAEVFEKGPARLP
jgi:prepilin-type N-terminal cleavage/methylation domain-containing protein